MSASLVGSEMCIRDRLYCPCLTPSTTEVVVDGSSRVGIFRTGWDEQVRSCLLYTSDAADDM
eukprot:10515514-Alexandrium_andersonii.AAC.1